MVWPAHYIQCRMLELKRMHVRKMMVALMRIIQWIYGHSKKDKCQDEVIHSKVGVGPIEDKMRKARLRWFGHVKWQAPDARGVKRSY